MQNLEKILSVLESYYIFKVNEFSYKLSESTEIDNIVVNFEEYKKYTECLNLINKMREDKNESKV